MREGLRAAPRYRMGVPRWDALPAPVSRRDHREGRQRGTTARPATPRSSSCPPARRALRRYGPQAVRADRPAAQATALRKGETVIIEGSGGAAFFIIDSGQAAVSSKGVDLANLGPGDYFGEVALIDGGPRSATVTAATDLVCYGLTFWEFRPLVERNGTIAWKLLQALAKQLRTASDSKSLSLSPSERRSTIS